MRIFRRLAVPHIHVVKVSYGGILKAFLDLVIPPQPRQCREAKRTLDLYIAAEYTVGNTSAGHFNTYVT